MSTTTTETTPAAPHADKVGHVTIVTTPDTSRSVWFYVIAALADGSVFGVNLGTNSGYLAPEGDGMRLQTARIGEYNDTNDPVSRLDATVRDALAAFLVGTAAPLRDGTETPEEAYARGKADQRQSDVTEFEAWKERATETAHHYADRNDLCGEFDRCMEAIGLPTRGSRTQTWEVTYTVEVSRSAVEDYGDPDGWDAEDLYNRAESGAGEPSSARLQ